MEDARTEAIQRKNTAYAALDRLRAMATEAEPIVLHAGYTDEEIVQLAIEDNENDEYHEPVSIVDTWASYQDLADMGWTQERIAGAKGVTQSLVSDRLKFNCLPIEIKEFIYQKLLSEKHLREITSISTGRYSSPWLTTATAQLELATWAARGQ